MSDDRPRFTRKSRRKSDPSERARLIAELARTSDAAPETFDMPRVAIEPDVPEVDPTEEWHPNLDAVAEAEMAAEEAFAAATAIPEIEQDVAEIDQEFLFDGEAPLSTSTPETEPGEAASPPPTTDHQPAEDQADTADLETASDESGKQPDQPAAPDPAPVQTDHAETTRQTAPDTQDSEPAPVAPSEGIELYNETFEPEPQDPGSDLEPAVNPSDDTDAHPGPEIEASEIAEPEAALEAHAEAEPEPEPETEPGPQPEEPTTPVSAPALHADPVAAPPESDGDIWSKLSSIAIDPAHLERNLIITAGRHDPAHGAFDVLRTRLVQTLYDNDWKRVAVTSPTRDCGKTFTAVNLAISLSRYEAMRTVLMDMDMRNPSVASVLGAPEPGAMGDFLCGTTDVQDHFVRLGRNALNIGNNLAVGLNNRVEPYASELIQDPRSDAAFQRMMQALEPDIVLYDLPPALAYDDVIAFKKFFDGVLMVVGGGSTTADEVHEAMRRLGDDVPLLGVVLNQAENEAGKGYTYGY